jgi:hypothetical protein
MICTECPAFTVYGICPQKPKREDYEDENKYLIDLESGVWDCKKTVEILCKELRESVQLIKWLKCELKDRDDWKGASVLASRVNKFLERYENDRT